jgi:drug/metabolite transporter (DMT)-like permease
LLSIVFGLTSALVWGAGDFSGGLVSRRAGAVRATLYGEASGILLLLVLVLASREPVIPLADWLWSGAAGACGALGLLALYHSLASGRMSIAAPVSALTAAALPVVVGSLTEGLPPLTTLAGFILALAAIWLISQTGSHGKPAHLQLSELAMPLLSGTAFGIYFILIHAGSRHGVFWPMVAARGAGTLALLAFAAFSHQLAPLEAHHWPLVGLNALLDVGGNTFYILAGRAGRLDVAAVLGSLYPGSTVLLAWVVLKEALNRSQLAGVLAALAAITLLMI